MKQNRNGFSGFSKGLFVGGVLGAAVALLYAPRYKAGLPGKFLREDAPSQRRFEPLSTKDIEKTDEIGTRVKPGTGWRMMFYVASAVAMISNWRMKKV